MTQFSPVYFGIHSPVKSDGLNQIHLNQEYLKNKIDIVPNGILRCVRKDPESGLYGGAYKIHSVGFTVASGRMIRITTSLMFHCSTSGIKYKLYYVLDNEEVDGPCNITGASQTNRCFSVSNFLYMPPDPLSKGDHQIDLMIKRTDENSMTGDASTRSVTTIIEDIGSFTSQIQN